MVARHRTNLILASGSPARLALLRAHGFDPKIRRPVVDETPKTGESPAQLVQRLALAKLHSVADLNNTTVAADTVVSLDGNIFGKPIRPDRAVELLTHLSGRTHEVFGGIAIQHAQIELCGVVRTQVTFRDLTPVEIDSYVATGEPLDKAGGYAIQGGAANFVTAINGCRDNVVGLSIEVFLTALRKLGAQPAG